MNDNAMGRTSPASHGRSAHSPPGSAALEGYKSDILNGFEGQPALHNPMNPDRTQTSPQVDLKDPIQVHLLTETALSDSREYEILSQEEVDDLKKQSQFIAQRIESVKSNLGIQAKYRDAAISMARLYSPGGPNDDQETEAAEVERQRCERKCEELATELFNLEKQLMEPHRRLLHHTAGILQLTHKASKRRIAQQNGNVVNGMPGSPESLYTYPQSRTSIDPGSDEAYMDEASFDQLEPMPRKTPIEIPMKSPIREQNNQLREEADRIRDENKQLRANLLAAEQKLYGVNGALRETIVKFSPSVNHDYDAPPQLSSDQAAEPTELLHRQLDYLDSGLVAVQAEQDSFSGSKATGERIEALNLQLRDLLMTSNHHYTPQPIPSEDDVNGQLAYLEDSLRLVDSELARATSGKDQDSDNIEESVRDLWGFIQSGFADDKRRRDDRRKARAERGLEEDKDMSEDEGFDPNESYSLDEFVTRVQWLFRQTTMLKDHNSVLKRQIKQQRELNNKSDAEKDAELQQKHEEVEQSRMLVRNAEQDAMNAQKMLSDALEDLEQARDAAQSSNGNQSELAERDAKVEVLEAKLKDLQHSLLAAESESKSTEARLAQVDAAIGTLSDELETATKEKHAAQEAAEKLQKSMGPKDEQLKANEGELEQLQMQLAELKTEVTIAKAELDGAYGTRAERAADVAARKNSGEVVKLQNQVEKLKKELSGTIEELEGITKESIAGEREKVELEGKLDDALAAKSALDAEIDKSRGVIARLQEELDGEKLSGNSSAGAKPSAGAAMLSERFRATMREERKKFQDDLKEERIKARKLEDELGRLKRSMGPGKSPLSPR